MDAFSMPLAMLKSTLQFGIDTIFPNRCALCAELSSLGFCPNCQKLLPWIESSCIVCNRQLSNTGLCGSCQIQKPKYDQSIIPFRYQAPVSNIIQRLKYSEQLHYAVALGKMLSSQLSNQNTCLPDAVIPMPLHRKRIMRRGFNQASEIAKQVCQSVPVALDQKLLVRIKNTQTQTGLSEKARKNNMQDAFVVKPGKHYRHVALLDDVVTSGATINSAASVLLKSGIDKITVWAIAKT